MGKFRIKTSERKQRDWSEDPSLAALERGSKLESRGGDKRRPSRAPGQPRKLDRAQSLSPLDEAEPPLDEA